MKFSNIACVAILGATLTTSAYADLASDQKAYNDAVKIVNFYQTTQNILTTNGANITSSNPLSVQFTGENVTLDPATSKLAKTFFDIFQAGADVIFGTATVSAGSDDNAFKVETNNMSAGIKNITIGGDTNKNVITLEDGKIKITKAGESSPLVNLTNTIFDTLDALIFKSVPSGTDTGLLPTAQTTAGEKLKTYESAIATNATALTPEVASQLNTNLGAIINNQNQAIQTAQNALNTANNNTTSKKQIAARSDIQKAFNAAKQAVDSSAEDAVAKIKAFGQALADLSVSQLVDVSTWEAISGLTISTDLTNAANDTKFKSMESQIQASLQYIGDDLTKLKVLKKAEESKTDLLTTLSKSITDTSVKSNYNSSIAAYKEAIKNLKPVQYAPSNIDKQIQAATTALTSADSTLNGLINTAKTSGDIKTEADKLVGTADNIKYLNVASGTGLSDLSSVTSLDTLKTYETKLQDAVTKLADPSIILTADEPIATIKEALKAKGFDNDTNVMALLNESDNFTSSNLKSEKVTDLQSAINTALAGAKTLLEGAISAVNTFITTNQTQIDSVASATVLKTNLEAVKNEYTLKAQYRASTQLRTYAIANVVNGLDDESKAIVQAFGDIAPDNSLVSNIVTSDSTTGTTGDNAVSTIGGVPTIIRAVKLEQNSLGATTSSLQNRVNLDLVKFSSLLGTSTRLAKLSNPFNSDLALANALNKLSTSEFASNDNSTLSNIIKEYTTRFSTDANLWGNVFGAKGNIKDGANPTIFGVSLGYDKAFDDLIAGGYFTYAKSRSNDIQVDQSADNYQLGVYGRKYIDNNEIDVKAYLGFANNKLTRNSLGDKTYSISATNQEGKFNSTFAGLNLGYGYVIDMGNALFIKPLVALNYDYLKNGSFNETGILPVNYSSTTSSILTAKLGTEIRKYVDSGNYFYVTPAVESEIYKSNKDSVVNFVGSSRDIVFGADNKKHNYLSLQTGMDLKVTPNLTTNINFGAKARSGAQIYNGNVGLRYSF